MNERQMKQTIQIVTVIAVVLLIVLGAILLVQTVQLKVAQDKLSALNGELDRLESERRTVEEELAYRESQAFIEEYAREYLNMIYRDEIVFSPQS